MAKAKRIASFPDQLLRRNSNAKNATSSHASHFIFTGNTEWGIQNLEYDAFTGDWIAAVYRGKKEKYPNYPMFIIDGAAAPYEDYIAYGRKGLHLSLKKEGVFDEATGIYGSTIYQTNIVPNQRKTAVSLSYTVTPMTPPMVLPK